MDDSSSANSQNQTTNDSSLIDNQFGQGGNVQQQKIVGNFDGDAISSKINIGQKIINNFSRGDKSYKVNKFSFDDTITLPTEIYNSIEHTFVYRNESMEDLITCLHQFRMLLFTGEPESGKNFTAISLAYHMMKENQTVYEIRWCDLFLKEIEIDLLNLIKTSKELKGKIVIFKDVFSKKNSGLLDFFCSCTREQTGHISQTLKELDTLFLFTADNGSFDPFLLSNLALKRDFNPGDTDLLLNGFDRKLKHFCSLSPRRDFNKASQLLEGRKKEIIEKLGRIPKIAHFIENYTDKLLFGGKFVDEAIEEALDIKKRLEHLFLKELGENKQEFEAWTFTLCLSLFNGISYADFHEIHNEITKLLLKNLDPFRTMKDFIFTTSDGEFFDRCRAHIVKDTFSHSYRIEFRNEEDQKVIMDILMRNNLKILLEIIPFLEKYVESHWHRKQRRLAAINLGHLGRLDTESVTFRLINKWTDINREDDIQWENVGFMYEGIITSEDKDYKKYCLNKLSSMAFSDDIGEQWTAISAYKHIGLHDLEFAMEELRKIQEKAIDRMNVKQSKNLLEFIYSQEDDSNLNDILEKMDQIYNETAYLISYVRYSVVALSGSVIFEPIAINPIDVIHELKKWISKGNRDSKANVAMLFFGPGGVLSELENIEVVNSDDDESDKKVKTRTNLLLYSMTDSEEAIKKLADFFLDLYKKCFPQFRLEINREFKKMLFDHMEKWTIESLYNKKTNEALMNLLVYLYQKGDEELKDTIWDSLNRWKVPQKKDERENKINEKEKMLDAFVTVIKNNIIKL